MSKLQEQLTAKEITEHLFSDRYSYDEFLKEYIEEMLKSDSSRRVYWDAWFRGATSKDLENAEKGKTFKQS